MNTQTHTLASRGAETDAEFEIRRALTKVDRFAFAIPCWRTSRLFSQWSDAERVIVNVNKLTGLGTQEVQW